MSCVRKLSSDFMHPIAVSEGDDLHRDLLDLLPSESQNLRLPTCFFQVSMIHEIGSDAVQHDESCGNSLVSSGHALSQGDKQNFDGGKPSVDKDIRVVFRRLAHEFFSFESRALSA